MCAFTEAQSPGQGRGAWILASQKLHYATAWNNWEGLDKDQEMVRGGHRGRESSSASVTAEQVEIWQYGNLSCGPAS